MVGGNQLAIDLDSVSIDKGSKAFYHFNAIFRQIIVIRAVNIFDILLAAMDQFLKVKTFDLDVKAIIWRIFFDGFGHLRAVPHDLFGYAA